MGNMSYEADALALYRLLLFLDSYDDALPYACTLRAV